MSRHLFALSLCICVSIALAIAVARAADPAPAKASAATRPEDAGWKLVWSDEFDAKEIDRTKWGFDMGNGFKGDNGAYVAGWGNQEAEFYTDRPENAYLADGQLHIKAIKENYSGSPYTSARMKTRKENGDPLFNQKYGRFEFRCKAPAGKGLWPAVWMMPQANKYGGWASSGEIDMYEVRGQKLSEVLGTIHYGGGWPNNAHSGETYTLPDNGSVGDWHVYALEWEPSEMRWSVDGKVYSTKNFWYSTSKKEKPASDADINPWPAPFDQPFYLIINLAVGGQFVGGRPDASTTFPTEFLVDYVRVYDKPAGYGPVKPRGPGKIGG